MPMTIYVLPRVRIAHNIFTRSWDNLHALQDRRMRLDHGSGKVLMHEGLVDGHLWSDIPWIDKCDLQDSDYAKDDAMAATHLMLITTPPSLERICSLFRRFPSRLVGIDRQSFLLM